VWNPSHQSTQRFEIGQALAAVGARGQMLLQIGRLASRQFAVDARAEQATRLEAGDDWPSATTGDLRIARSRSRARASLDITVPTGE
jgi:hypothetical protein